MDLINALPQNFQWLVIAIVGFAALSIFFFVRHLVSKHDLHPFRAVSGVVVGLYNHIVALVKFFGQALTEADGNGGRTSFSRVMGVYVIYKIVLMADAVKDSPTSKIPAELMVMFWVLVGYQALAKVLNNLTPAVLDIARAVLLKVNPSIPGLAPRSDPPPKEQP